MNQLKTYLHYDNTAMQYTAILNRCKNDSFQMKICDFFFDEAVLTSTHDLCFRSKIKKIMYTPVKVIEKQ